MRRLIRNLRLTAVLFALVFLILIGGIVYHQQRSLDQLWGHEGENKQALRERYARAGTIYASDGTILAESDGNGRHYAENPVLAASLVQLIGDYTHNIGNTVEERYEGLLTGSRRTLLKQIAYDILGHGKEGSDLYLSLNSELCLRAAELLQGHKAAAVVLNYKSGEILCLVNLPGTAPENVVQWSDIPEGALFNRALQGTYSPGSTFKIITDAAWIRSPNFDPELVVECRGETPLLGPGSVNEYRADAGHGRVQREAAMAVSCNHFFGEAGIRSGASLLRETAAAFGFNQSLRLDEIRCAGSRIELPPEVDDYVLSWLSIGQPVEGADLTVTPLQLALISAGVANDGIIMQPRLVLAEKDPLGNRQVHEQAGVLSHCGSADEMRVISGDMQASASYGFASSAAISGEIIGAKTGTAQWTDEAGDVVNNSLFSGFLRDDELPLAIGLVIEGQTIDTSAIARELILNALRIFRSR